MVYIINNAVQSCFFLNYLSNHWQHFYLYYFWMILNLQKCYESSHPQLCQSEISIKLNL
jgi:hypothetical protein